nr:hypothetical protein [Tanacetum cinerariifolium]
MFIRSRVIWERVRDFQLDKPTTGLIYLNSKNEKRVMDLIDISKFCDATLERVLKEVKLKIFETEFLKKAPLLDEKMGVIREWKINSTDDEALIIINRSGEIVRN